MIMHVCSFKDINLSLAWSHFRWDWKMAASALPVPNRFEVKFMSNMSSMNECSDELSTQTLKPSSQDLHLSQWELPTG